MRYQDLVDSEDRSAAAKWLECMANFQQYHHFDTVEHVLDSYRQFLYTEKAWDRLPEVVKKLKTKAIIRVYPGYVPGSWGHYCCHWLTMIDGAAKMDGHEIEDDMLIALVNLQVDGFLPPDFDFTFPEENHA